MSFLCEKEEKNKGRTEEEETVISCFDFKAGTLHNPRTGNIYASYATKVKRWNRSDSVPILGFIPGFTS